MSSDSCPDSGLYRALLGIARERGIAQRAVHLVDKGSVGSGSLLHTAGAAGRDDDHTNLPESDAAGSGAGEGHEDHAGGIQRVFLLLSRRAGALLAGQQHPLHCAAVADYAHDRAVEIRSCRTLTQLLR